MLRRQLRRLARDFADEVARLLDRHGTWHRSGPSAGHARDRDRAPKPQRQRRSAASLKDIGDRIIRELGSHSQPMAISTIAAQLGVEPRQIAHPIALLVGQGLVIQTGERRGTRYQLAPRRAAPRRGRDSLRPEKAKRRR